MPTRYVLEMFCDRIAASQTYKGKKYRDTFPLAYYENGKHSYIMHPQTRQFLEHLLHYLHDHGLDETIQYINSHPEWKKNH